MTDADLDDMCRLLGDAEVMRYYPVGQSGDWVARCIRPGLCRSAGASGPPPPHARPTHRTARRTLTAVALSAAALTGPAASATVVALPVTAGVTGAAAPQAHAVAWDQVELVDDAGVIDLAQLRRDLAGIEFREPTRVAVVTERGPDLSALDDDRASQAFNGRVLERARAEHPDWLSADGQKWADGLVIVALDPDNRLIGVYVGEDRMLSTDRLREVREAGHEAARAARWTDTVVEVTDAAAELIGRPWWQAPELWFGAGIVGVAGGGAAAAALASRRRRRRGPAGLLGEARTHLTSVTLEMDATEVNASTVPEDSPHAAALMERFRNFRRQALDASVELDRLEALPERSLHRTEHARAAEDVRDRARELDRLDDAVAAANTFLNRHPGWPAAWDQQTAPLRADLDAVGTLASSVGSAGPVRSAVAALESFRTEAQDRLEALGADLQDERLTPAAALDELDALRRRLTGLVSALADAEVAAFGKDEAERELLRDELRTHRGPVRSARGSILDSALPADAYWTVVAFTTGHQAGERSVQDHRQAQSSSSEDRLRILGRLVLRGGLVRPILSRSGPDLSRKLVRAGHPVPGPPFRSARQ
ncbi:DUF5129 domain-containing protein [Micrococcus sp. HSID17227]|uniref:DUF5129 domain-containing protein n=2 Tax=unclassified Micrococcus TaxID=2620948 RepID=UPI001EE7FB9D|nr:DUF5129 domain-containing protein [Micrococcus sp. HSID17227]